MENITRTSISSNWIMETYRTLKVLNIIYSEVGQYHLPFGTFGTLLTQFLVNSSMIRVTGSGNIPMYVGLVLGLVSIYFGTVADMCLRGSGNLYESCQELKLKMLSSRSRVVRREARSLYVLSLNIGKFYRVEKSTVLSYFAMLQDYTVAVLMY